MDFADSPLASTYGHKTIEVSTGAHINERQRDKEALRPKAERYAMLLEVTSELIRASELGDLGRTTFEHIKSALGAAVCTNYRLDPTGQQLRLVFVNRVAVVGFDIAADLRRLQVGRHYKGCILPDPHVSCDVDEAERAGCASRDGDIAVDIGDRSSATYEP
jgi:GAF domain-containing protein